MLLKIFHLKFHCVTEMESHITDWASFIKVGQIDAGLIGVFISWHTFHIYDIRTKCVKQNVSLTGTIDGNRWHQRWHQLYRFPPTRIVSRNGVCWFVILDGGICRIIDFVNCTYTQKKLPPHPRLKSYSHCSYLVLNNCLVTFGGVRHESVRVCVRT